MKCTFKELFLHEGKMGGRKITISLLCIVLVHKNAPKGKGWEVGEFVIEHPQPVLISNIFMFAGYRVMTS